MTDRAAAPTERATACPFVAFEDDRDERSDRPDHRHRCFAESRPAPRAIAHQEAFCLSPAFAGCPTFQDWARREAAHTSTVRERLDGDPGGGAGDRRGRGRCRPSIARRATIFHSTTKATTGARRRPMNAPAHRPAIGPRHPRGQWTLQPRPARPADRPTGPGRRAARRRVAPRPRRRPAPERASPRRAGSRTGPPMSATRTTPSQAARRERQATTRAATSTAAGVAPDDELAGLVGSESPGLVAGEDDEQGVGRPGEGGPGQGRPPATERGRRPELGATETVRGLSDPADAGRLPGRAADHPGARRPGPRGVHRLHGAVAVLQRRRPGDGRPGDALPERHRRVPRSPRRRSPRRRR